jgi:hypothetical protein
MEASSAWRLLNPERADTSAHVMLEKAQPHHTANLIPKRVRGDQIEDVVREGDPNHLDINPGSLGFCYEVQSSLRNYQAVLFGKHDECGWSIPGQERRGRDRFRPIGVFLRATPDVSLDQHLRIETRYRESILVDADRVDGWIQNGDGRRCGNLFAAGRPSRACSRCKASVDRKISPGGIAEERNA